VCVADPEEEKELIPLYLFESEVAASSRLLLEAM
jgi:hypothetical protein